MSPLQWAMQGLWMVLDTAARKQVRIPSRMDTKDILEQAKGTVAYNSR